MQDMQPCIEKHENHSIPGLLSSDDNSLLETKLFLQTIEELLCRSSIVIWLWYGNFIYWPVRSARFYEFIFMTHQVKSQKFSQTLMQLKNEKVYTFWGAHTNKIPECNTPQHTMREICIKRDMYKKQKLETEETAESRSISGGLIKNQPSFSMFIKIKCPM